MFWFKVHDAGIFEEGRSVDYPGALFLSVCILSLLVAMTVVNDYGFTSTVVLFCMLVFLVMLVVFALWERRAAEPLVKLSLLTGNGSGAHVSAFLFGISMFMLYQTLPFLFSSPEAYGGFGIDDTFDIGLIMLPMAIMGLVFGPKAGKWCKGRGAPIKVLAAGMLMFALGDLLLILMHDELWMVVLCLCVSGVGNALAMVSMINVVVETAPAQDFGIASGMNTMFRLIGGSIGPVLGAMILSEFVAFSMFSVSIYDIEGYVWTWAAGALFCFVGTVSAMLLKPKIAQA